MGGRVVFGVRWWSGGEGFVGGFGCGRVLRGVVWCGVGIRQWDKTKYQKTMKGLLATIAKRAPDQWGGGGILVLF